VLVLTSTPAWAHGRPENRVWGFSEKPADFAAQETAKPIDTPGENPGCGYDFASGVHKYLYCKANLVDMVDPSGHDGELGGLMMSTSIGASLDAMYNGAVTTTGDALRATILGVEENESAQQIITGYLLDVGTGVAEGIALGVAMRLSDELITGSGCLNACFVAGTPVATELGEKPIEQIKTGDLVWSWDERTGDFGLANVVSTHVRQVSNEVIVKTGDEAFTTTTTHPFYIENKGWTEAGSLQPGDRFLTLGGESETVTSTASTNTIASVFNFEVADTHTYLVGERPVVVHNACAWGTRKASIPKEPGIYVIRASNGQRYVGQAENLSGRLTRGNHKYQTLIEDPNSELFTMTLDTTKVKGSTKDALDAVENFYIKALGAKRVSGGLNGRWQRNPETGWESAYLKQYGFPSMEDPVSH
jgi:hypothetical protein